MNRQPTWQILTHPDDAWEEATVTGLVEHNLAASAAIRRRFEPENVKLNTWEFQAPAFYGRCGYEVYAREVDYPPGHTNHLMRKDL